MGRTGPDQSVVNFGRAVEGCEFEGKKIHTWSARRFAVL